MIRLIVIILIAAFPVASAQCLTVDAEWVTAQDLADKIPQYGELDPDLKIVRAPFPGARRLVDRRALPAVEGEIPEASFCLERRLRVPTNEAFAEALRLALIVMDGPEIGFELVDYDRSMVPSGKLEFLTNALPPPLLSKANEPVLWRGKLFYAEGHSVPVWMRVRLWIEGEVCLLSRDVDRGSDFSVDDCKLGKLRYPPFISPPIKDPRALERMVAARRMKAGEPIYPTQVVHKPDVEAGKPVEMKVVNGGAQVKFQAKAATSGRRGDVVAVTNPANGKRMEGQVVGQGAVEVHLK